MPQNADKYHVFTDEAHPAQPPTNGRVKDLMRLQLQIVGAAVVFGGLALIVGSGGRDGPA